MFFIDIFNCNSKIFISHILNNFEFNSNKSWGISGGGVSTTCGIEETARATKIIQMKSGRTKQMQQIVVITIQTVLDFLGCWMITGAGAWGGGGGA
jgi:hypothetical protein